MNDFASNVPASVRKQAEESDAIMKRLQNSAPEGENEEVVETNMVESGNETETPQGTEPSQEGSTPAGDDESFEQKYRVLQGKYNAEIPRLQNQVSQLYQEVSRLQHEKEQLSQQPGPEQNIPDQKEISGIDPESLSEYGDEFGNLAKSFNALLEQNKRLQEELGSIKDSTQHIQKDQHSTKEARFWDALSQTVPQWQDVNQNQDFLNWLTQEDPVSGTVRQRILEHHQGNFNAQGVANVFKAWMNESGHKANKQSTETAETKPQPRNVQPQTTRAEGPDAASQGQWTRAQIKEHYDSYNKGKWSGREDEWKKIERQMMQAVQEGRVR